MIGETLRVGDTVVVNIPDENWDWGYRPVKKQRGTKIKVVGFGEIAYSRIQNFGRGPGVYTNHSWVQLKGIEGFVSTCFIKLANKKEEAKRLKEFRKNRPVEKPLRPLPEMKFWEGDVVEVAWWDGHNPWGEEDVVVVSINYDYLDQKRNDGSPMPEYNVSPSEMGGYVAVNESQMKLVRRGNVWKYYNGEKPVFKDIQEEADFFKMLGHCDEVPNPKTKLYAWTKDEILKAVKDGIVDGFSADHGLFGTMSDIQHRAMRFRDRDLGERVRQATIKGFNL